MEILMKSPKAKLCPLLPKVYDRVRTDELVKVFSIQGSDRLKIMAAADKFNLKCFEVYAALCKIERIEKQKCVHQRRRAHKEPVERANIVGQKQVREVR